jgi:hypothetical protein
MARLLAVLISIPALAFTQTPQKVLGWIGQSNMTGYCDVDTLTSVTMPDDATLGSAISYYQVDLDGYSDRDGQISPMAFLGWPASQDRRHGLDYQPNLLVDSSGDNSNSFGPDLAASLLVSWWTGEHIVNCKLAVAGAFLSQPSTPPVISFPFERMGSYLWSGAFSTFDLDIPWLGENNCFQSADLYAGANFALSRAGQTGCGLRDQYANWAIDQWIGKWVFADGLMGKVSDNSTNALTVPQWFPAAVATPSAGRHYSIQNLSMQPASIAKSWLHGYCATTKELLQAQGKVMDMRCVGIQIGESDSLQLSTALQVQAKMTRLIGWLRAGLTQSGMTTVQQHKIGIILGLTKENAPWTHAAIVNQAYRNIANADPFVSVTEVSGIPVGGDAPSPMHADHDPLHYTADGQILNGLRFATEILQLMASQ